MPGAGHSEAAVGLAPTCVPLYKAGAGRPGVQSSLKTTREERVTEADRTGPCWCRFFLNKSISLSGSGHTPRLRPGWKTPVFSFQLSQFSLPYLA